MKERLRRAFELHRAGRLEEAARERAMGRVRRGLPAQASAAQIRRPISAESVGRWKCYADRLGPLIEALGPLADPS